MNSEEFKSRVVTLSPKLYLIAIRFLKHEEEARDAVQEVMVRLWKTRKQLRSHPNPSGYACLTMRNLCLDLIRKTEPSRTNEINISEVAIPTTDHDGIDDREIIEIIDRIITCLPEKQREIVLMRDIDGLEFDEIELITGLRKELIRVTLSRARKSIREHLEKVYNYEYGKGRQA